jgi:enamine deaminase RidA (YjgF/YER057c/UK114 family)
MFPFTPCQPAVGTTFSVVELNGVHHVFATAVPPSGHSLEEQTRSVLEAVNGVLQKVDAAGSLLHLTVFLADVTQMAACRQTVRRLLGNNTPATSYVGQPPCDGSLVAVEALALGKGRDKVHIRRISDQLLLAQQDSCTWIYADQAVPLTSAPGVYEKTICSYQHLRRLLPQGGARLDQVLRTWLHLGSIVEDDGPTQRYKELNRARADVYAGVPFLAERLPDDCPGAVFPASTGIGTTGRGVTLSAVALLSDEDNVIAVPLENPRQTSAFAYAAHYSPQSPKFSRGMAVVHGPDTTLFISGTASITNAETRHPGDVVAQTHETLANITALISQENLARHGLPGRGTTLQGMAVGRVYVKRLGDYPAVRQVCAERLPGVPLNYVVADVCRPDLLVEIEGIAFSNAPGIEEAPGAVRVRRCAARRGECQAEECRHLCPDSCPELACCPHAVRR